MVGAFSSVSLVMMKQYLKLEVETTKTGNTFTSLDLSKRTERQETNNND
jgi:hypothetical protein